MLGFFTKDYINRDYQRVYRAGVKVLAAKLSIKTCKTHRCALDIHYTLVYCKNKNKCPTKLRISHVCYNYKRNYIHKAIFNRQKQT